MASTSLWKIKERLDHVLDYAGNEEKTKNPVFNESELQGLRDVMNYTYQDYKTEKQHYVSGINCSPETARQEMIDTKKQYNKTGGIIAFHGYQSFAKGEVTPELAHEIGMKLATEMWGNRFEVIVATHLDKSHIHNHFVLNSVSFADGYKYYSNYDNTDRFRIKSDRLCEEYNLSVTYTPKRGRLPNPKIYQEEQWGGESYRSQIRAAVDKAIGESLTERQFYANLKKNGYEIKVGKDITVKAPGRKYGLKLFRNLGEDYTTEAINRRILSHGIPQRSQSPPEPTAPPPKRVQFKGNIQTVRKFVGFRALYVRYFYLLGGRPQWQLQGQRPPSVKQVHYLFRDDIKKMHQLSDEMKLLGRNHIDCAEQLSSYKEGVSGKITELTDKRQILRYKTRRVKDETALATLKSEIAGISAELSTLRREVRLCDSITTRTADMREKIRQAAELRAKENQIETKKEEKTYDQWRRRR